MGVTRSAGAARWLAALATSAPRALVVEAPGWGAARLEVESALRGRGWSRALSPADADVLLVVGVPGDGLGRAVERTWEQMPGPRARGAVPGPGGPDGRTVRAVLDAAAGVLRDADHQRADAVGRSSWSAGDGDGMDVGDGDGMGTGGMDMAPGGIPLAEGDASDRDGLEMDVLHVPLGPVLPAWPAGLVLRTTLSGDVVTAVEVEVLPAGGVPPAGSAGVVPDAVALVDRAARLLALAGADGPVAELERWCDAVLRRGDGPRGDLDEALERTVRRVRRSRLLRWSLRGLGRLDAAALAAHGLPDQAGGDVHDRLLRMLDDARAAPSATDGHRATDPPGGGAGASTGTSAAWSEAVRAALPGLVTGYELAAVRLVVASLPDPTAVQPAGAAR